MNHAQLPRSVRFAGIVTTAELSAAGLSRAKIAVLLKRGVLTKLCHGIYAPSGHLAELHEQDERAGRLAAIAAAVATARDTRAGQARTAPVTSQREPRARSVSVTNRAASHAEIASQSPSSPAPAATSIAAATPNTAVDASPARAR
jgi:hypothetical protein